MSKNLVIVESATKAKTIEKILGKDFKVASCFGHISDLPSNELGVDVDGNFVPKYIISSDKKKIVSELKKLSKQADIVWLASDEDVLRLAHDQKNELLAITLRSKVLNQKPFLHTCVSLLERSQLLD